MNIPRFVLAQRQLGEEFSKKENTTLLSYETTKFDSNMRDFIAFNIRYKDKDKICTYKLLQDY